MSAKECLVSALSVGLFVMTLVAGVVQSLRVDRKLPAVNLFSEGAWNYIHDLLAHDDVDGAIAQLEMRKRIQPQDADTYEPLGSLLARSDRPQDARDNYEELVRLRPDYARGHHLLGTTYLNTNQPNLAARTFTRSIQLDPNSAPAYNGIGVILARQGQIAEAEKYFAKAVELDPNDEGARINLERARIRP